MQEEVDVTICLPWAGSHRKSDGRPLAPDGLQYAYRWLWQQANGPLDPGLILHHLCENEWCVRLEHLEALTQSEHARAHGFRPSEGYRKRTHCPHGHPYAGDNLIVDSRGWRKCRACTIEAKRRYRARKREE